MTSSIPSLAVWKFASCDGCQLTLLNCEDDLLPLADRVRISYFLEASSATVEGPYDLSLVEGSITTPDDVTRIGEVRAMSSHLVTIGACATAGGIQALRNFTDIEELLRIVYATPSYLSTLDKSTPISDHVAVDYELRGCPIDRRQLIEVISAYLTGRPPAVADQSVCMECKMRGLPCVMVTAGEPCLGPVTHAGCDALCPGFGRGCYGCFGPKERAEAATLAVALRSTGIDEATLDRLFHTFNAWSPGFRDVPVAAPTRRRDHR